jgi:hypothetical protein
MSVKNLNRVLKTVLAGSVKLAAPADRIGFGVNTVIDHYPTAFLSQGQFPTPRLPESEPRSRRTAADDRSMPPQGLPAGPNGSGSGKSASRCHGLKPVTTSLARTLSGTAIQAVSEMGWRMVDTSRASHPGSNQRLRRIGSDCQSPDRQNARTDLAANPRQRGWHRTATPTATAGK